MRILVINGSPKGERSNTYRLTAAFLDGLRETGEPGEVRELTVSRLKLKPCLGCFSCWNKTPGQCCLSDDMGQVIEAILWADLTVWSFPLYYFSVPGPLKTLIDRQLPMSLPFMTAESTSGSHPSRYDLSGKRTVVISTCGFHTAEGNYDGVSSLFDHLCGPGNYTALFCGQGELFRVPELRERTEAYLQTVRQAGREYRTGGITPATRAELNRPLLPRETFEAMADASWGVDRDTGGKETETLIFTRQMAALYRKENWPGRDLVLEMVYTDVQERYQILLTEEGSRVLTDNFRPAGTVIETPVTVWRAIAAGEVSGSEALSRRQYRVEGDFSLLLNWDRYFSGGESEEPAAPVSPDALSPSFTLLLTPWIVLWAAVPIHTYWGSLLSLAACALTPLLFRRHRQTVYDLLSGALVTLLAGAALAGAPLRAVIPLAYLAFGVMWTASCFLHIPLTAHYVTGGYGGDSALANPLFLRTNRILTLAWGVLYLFTPIWTYFLLGTSLGGWTGALNSVLPLLMGWFTAWFQKWYPARFARGASKHR